MWKVDPSYHELPIATCYFWDPHIAQRLQFIQVVPRNRIALFLLMSSYITLLVSNPEDIESQATPKWWTKFYYNNHHLYPTWLRMVMGSSITSRQTTTVSRITWWSWRASPFSVKVFKAGSEGWKWLKDEKRPLLNLRMMNYDELCTYIHWGKTLDMFRSCLKPKQTTKLDPRVIQIW